MSAGTEESSPRGRARYFTPRPLHLAPGVVQDDTWKDSPFDYFIGTMEALVASGLGDVSMFPGQPGVGITKATYNPMNVERRLVPDYRGELEPVSLWRVPGRMEIARRVDGLFTVKVTVSYEEQDAREQARKEREEQRAEQRAAATPAVADISGETLAIACLNRALQHWGLEGVLSRLGRGTGALAKMGMFHKRKLPAGWRVIEGHGAGAAT